MRAGEIVLVKFPFANLEVSKKRPALVLSRVEVGKGTQLVTIAMITSKLDGLRLDGDIKIQDWQKAKLLHPSLLRLSKVATLDGDLIEKKLGVLSDADQKEASRVFRKLFAHWI